MVGSGIFYLGSYVLMRTGMSLGLALVAWIVGGIVSLLGPVLCGIGRIRHARRRYGRVSARSVSSRSRLYVRLFQLGLGRPRLYRGIGYCLAIDTDGLYSHE